MKTAVITGASSGLGVELLRAAVELCPDIDTFWLIARRRERLEALAAQFPGKTLRPVPLDLTDPSAVRTLERLLEKEKPALSLLINNAGFGRLCDFPESEPGDQTGMIDLNCRALTAVTRCCLPYMTAGSLILNISSIASFAPTPRMTVYCSTKAYVQSFSRALREELRPRGINVLAAVPARWTRNSCPSRVASTARAAPSTRCRTRTRQKWPERRFPPACVGAASARWARSTNFTASLPTCCRNPY